MTNRLLEEFTGNRFSRSCGLPVRCNSFREYYIYNSIEEIEEFIVDHNETDCYMSVYSYEEYNQIVRNKMSAVLDCIPFDFDCANNVELAYNDLKILLSWCNRHDIKPRVSYSAGKGFHAFIDIKPIKLNHPQQVLNKFAFEINKAAGFTTLDLQVIGDLERIIRIPNTINSKTGRYCIPLNPSLIPFLSIKTIEQMSMKKSTYVPIRCENDGEIRTLLEEYDVIVEQEIEEIKKKIEAEELKKKNSLFPYLNEGVACPAFRDYMDNGVEYGNHDYCICGMIHKLKSDGYTKDKIYRELVEFGNRCTPALQDSHIRLKLNGHWNKSYSFCTFFSKVSKMCVSCPNRRF